MGFFPNLGMVIKRMAKLVACDTCGKGFIAKSDNTMHINDGVIYRRTADGQRFEERIADQDYCANHTPTADGPVLTLPAARPEPDREG